MLNWIVSYPKSGNTWVRLFMQAYLNGGDVDINNIPFCSRSDIAPLYHKIVSPQTVDDTMDKGIVMMIRGAALFTLVHMLRQRKAQNIIDNTDPEGWIKSHNARIIVDEMQMVPLHFINKAIYIVRDPRDVALSMVNHFNVTIDEATELLCTDNASINTEEGMFWMLSSWQQHVANWMNIPNRTIYTYKYEDMLTNPEQVFKGIIVDVAKWEWDKNVFQRALDATTFSVLQEQEDNNRFVETPENARFFDKGQSGRWKTELSEKNIKKIEHKNQRVMQFLGYECKYYENKA